MLSVDRQPHQHHISVFFEKYFKRKSLGKVTEFPLDGDEDEPDIETNSFKGDMDSDGDHVMSNTGYDSNDSSIASAPNILSTGNRTRVDAEGLRLDNSDSEEGDGKTINLESL